MKRGVCNGEDNPDVNANPFSSNTLKMKIHVKVNFSQVLVVTLVF
jgi:hypothetical protein